MSKVLLIHNGTGPSQITSLFTLYQFLSFCGLEEGSYDEVVYTDSEKVAGFLVNKPKVILMVGDEVVRFFYPSLEFNSVGELSETVYKGIERLGGGDYLVMFMSGRYSEEYEATVWGINATILRNLLALP